MNNRSIFNRGGPSWAEQIKFRSAQAQKANKIIPQAVIDYHMKRSGRIPDILRRELDRQKAMAVPENLQRDADRYLKKSYFGKRKRRSLSSWSTSSPATPSGRDFFNQLTSVYETRNLRTSFYEVGFLTKNEGRVYLKCQPARYRTQMPDTTDDLNPRLLAQILEERKFPKSVKRSRFHDFFQG